MTPEVEAAIIAGGVGVLTLIGTLAARFYGIRRTSRDTKETLDRTLAEQRKRLDKTLAGQRDQLDRTLAEQRDQLDRTLTEQRTRTLNERFATAADKLGSDKPPAVRLAEAYAMAGLADDWPEGRQTCVDVLCGYLRLPYEADPGGNAPTLERLAFRADCEVRHTVIRVITTHLKDGATVPWQSLNFDFTGVVFDGGSFNFANFSGDMVDFGGAVFSSGYVSFSGAVFSGSLVSFSGAVFCGSTVHFGSAEFSSGTVNFGDVEFYSGRVYFAGVGFSGGTVDFGGAVIHGSVYFVGAEFSHGTVNFGGALFFGGTVDFGRAEFSGGTLDFSSVSDWSSPPEFPWTDTPPPDVKLPRSQINPSSRLARSLARPSASRLSTAEISVARSGSEFVRLLQSGTGERKTRPRDLQCSSKVQQLRRPVSTPADREKPLTCFNDPSRPRCA